MEQFHKALRHTQNAMTVKIKLTKSNGAYLTIEITQPTITGGRRNIIHEIPVSLVPQELWKDYQEPEMPDIDVSISLPPLKLIKSIIDKMKSLSTYITLSANMNGKLQIQLETDVVTAATYFKNLPNHQFDQVITRSDTMYEARVEIKKFSLLLTGHFNPTKVICNIVDGQGLQLFLLHQDISLQYYIPAVSY
jgi:HUS1 checkpoint protein